MVSQMCRVFLGDSASALVILFKNKSFSYLLRILDDMSAKIPSEAQWSNCELNFEKSNETCSVVPVCYFRIPLAQLGDLFFIFSYCNALG